jgi:asparagine synthase (glutamine-hydrolysing)
MMRLARKGLRSINCYLLTLNVCKKMCGIAGQFNFQRGKPIERETIVRMARSVAHRGPDDEGFFIAGPVGLGFRRLSIIDLASGHQPMSDAEETVWIIFNGEIYNYKELRGNCKARAISLERIRTRK